MSGMEGFINFNGTLEGSIAGGGGGDVTDVKVRDSQETTFESVVNEEGIAEIDLISYVRRNELAQAIENVENSIDNVEELIDTKQNIINYSTEEQVIGTYFGKPRYQKTYRVASPTANTTNVIQDSDVQYINEVIFINGSYQREITGTDYVLNEGLFNYENNSYNSFARVVKSSPTVSEVGIAYKISIGTGQAIKNLNITVQYTKTTD